MVHAVASASTLAQPASRRSFEVRLFIVFTV
jgi:hypothetical protein